VPPLQHPSKHGILCLMWFIRFQICQPGIWMVLNGFAGWSSTDLHSVTCTNARYAYRVCFGVPLMDLVPQNSRLGWLMQFVTPRIKGGINVRRRVRFLNGSLRTWTSLRRPSAKIHHCVLPSFTPLTRAAVFPRFLSATLHFTLGCSWPSINAALGMPDRTLSKKKNPK